MLATVDPQEYRARRERLGIVSPKTVISRSTIKPSAVAALPAPENMPEPKAPQKRKANPKPRDFLYVTERKPLNAAMRLQITRDILQTTSFKHGVTEEEILGRRQSQDVVRARHECFYRLSKEIGYSLPKIGMIMGDRDHTTVLHGIRKHEARLRDAQE